MIALSFSSQLFASRPVFSMKVPATTREMEKTLDFSLFFPLILTLSICVAMVSASGPVTFHVTFRVANCCLCQTHSVHSPRWSEGSFSKANLIVPHLCLGLQTHYCSEDKIRIPQNNTKDSLWWTLSSATDRFVIFYTVSTISRSAASARFPPLNCSARLILQNS